MNMLRRKNSGTGNTGKSGAPGRAMGRLAKSFALFLSFAGLLLGATNASAVACTAIASSAWNVQTTWGAAGTGCAGAPGGIPGAADTVTVPTAVTVTAAAAATSLTVNGTGSIVNNSTLTISGALAGTGGLTNSATGILNIGGNATITTLTATAAGNTVNYTGAAQTAKVTAYSNLTLSGSGAKTFATTPTVNGVLSLEGTATVVATTGVVTYGAAATLQYNTATARTTTLEEWPATYAATGGVIIKNTGVITLNANKVLSNGVPLTIDLGATLTTAARTLNVGGDLTVNGTLTGTSGAITLSGTAPRTIDGTGSIIATTTGRLLITTSRTILNTANLTIARPTTLSAATTVTNNGIINKSTTTALTGANATTSIWVNATGSTLNYAGTNAPMATGVLTASAAGNTVNYNGAAQAVEPTTAYHHLTLSGSAAKTMGATTVNGNFTMSGTATTAPTGALTVGGDFTIGATNTFANGANALNVAGNFAQDGTFTAGAGVVTLNGGAAVQTLSGTGPLGFANLTVSNAGITLARNVTVTSAIIGAVSLTSTCPTDYTLTSNGGATVAHSCQPTVVNSINLVSASPTNAASVSWTVVFNTSVTGVSSSNFALVPTGLGGTPAITGVSGSGTTWTVTASTGTGDGTLRLNMVNTTGVSPAITGLPFTTGQVYTLDRTAPVVSSIARVDPTPTALANVSWTVTFSESVTGVDAADFALVQTGGVSGALITSVTGGGASWTVTVSTGIGQGTLGLNLVDNDSIMDGASNPLGGTGAGNGNATGEVYIVTRPSVYYHDTTTGVNIGFDGPTNVTSGANQTIPPIITASLITANTCAGNARSNNHPVGLYTHSRWYLTTDYAVATNIGANPTGSASLSGQAATDTVIVSLYDYDPVLGGKTLIGSSAAITLTGGGTATAYPYTISSPLYAVPAGHRLMLEYNFNQPNGGNNARVFCSAASAYITVTETTAPATVSSINRADPNPTNAASVSWTVTFNTGVTGVSSSNFSLVPSGLGGTPAITSVAGSGTTWTVTASTGTGNGTLGLDMVNVAGISPAVITAMPFTGQVYSIDRVAPVVSSITRIDPTPTALASVSWTVNFSEIVIGVDAADFALVWAGGAGGGSITSVTQDIGNTWIVTASTGVSNGTLGLNLVDNDTIIDAAGNPLGGAGAANGDSVGEVYALNFTAPSFVFTDSTCAHNIAFGAPGQTCALVTWSPQVAGQDSPGVYITAVNAAGIPTRLNAALRTRNMQFGLACHDPVADAGIPAVFAGLALPLCQPSGGTPAAWSAAVTVTFNGGIPSSAVSYVFNYADVGSVELWMRNSATPAQVGFSGPFVVKPDHFDISSVVGTVGAVANPAAADATGTKFIKAGEALSVTLKAMTAAGVPTPNYGKETVAQGVRLTPTIVAPAGGHNPTLTIAGTGTVNDVIGGVEFGATGQVNTDANGVATVTNLAWNEVGVITLAANADNAGANNYLGAGAVLGATTGTVGNIGRFYAAKFALSPGGVIANRTDLAGCTVAGCGTFTYMGEQMNALFTLTAQAVDGTTTLQNYNWSATPANQFAKLNPTAAVTAGTGGPLDMGAVDSAATRTPFPPCGVVPAHSCLTPAQASAGTFASGVADIAVPFAIYRDNTAATGPYAVLDIGVAPVDSDGAALTYNLDTVNVVAGAANHTLVGQTQARYGRMKLSNAHGSELLPLTINVAAQFWNGTNYVTNALDNNSTFAATDVILNNYTKNLASGETSVVTPHPSEVFTGGVASYQLARPSGGDGKYDGSVNMTVNALSAYLPSNTARATFGVYKGNNEFIYLREAY